MTKAELFTQIVKYRSNEITQRQMLDAVDAVFKSQHGSKPNVIGSLPVDITIKEIENAMERWHLGRDNDDETLKTINDALVKIGLLGWFNRQISR